MLICECVREKPSPCPEHGPIAQRPHEVLDRQIREGKVIPPGYSKDMAWRDSSASATTLTDEEAENYAEA